MVVGEENLLNIGDTEFCECRVESCATWVDEEGPISVTEDTCIDMSVMDVYVMAELGKLGLHRVSLLISYQVGNFVAFRRSAVRNSTVETQEILEFLCYLF